MRQRSPARVVKQYVGRGRPPPSQSSAERARAGHCRWQRPRRRRRPRALASFRFEREAELLRDVGLADHVAIADARDPVALSAAVTRRSRRARQTSPWSASTFPAASTAQSCRPSPEGGTVIFFSMATSFTAAALGAEGLASDVTMLDWQRVHARSCGVRLRLAPTIARRSRVVHSTDRARDVAGR